MKRKGNSDGQNNCYQYGIGTVNDEKKTFQWYLKSAEGGYSDGQNNLGYCYEYGIRTTLFKYFKYFKKTAKDEDNAFKWYFKSAEEGNITGQYNLGRCYQQGIGTTKDEESAFQWYLKGEIVLDRIILVIAISKGLERQKNEEKVFHWYSKPAEGGNIGGQNGLGFVMNMGLEQQKMKRKHFSAEGENEYGLSSVEYLYRNEIVISKSERNKFKLIQDLKNDDSTCCICRKENSCSEICKKYFQINIQKNICSNCKLIEINYLTKWTSGNYEVDKIIHMSQLDENAREWEIWRWIDYDEFKNIEKLAEGGFGSIWKAEWTDMAEKCFGFYKSNQVVLKKLQKSQQINSEFLEELMVNFHCRDKYLPIFGIIQDLKTKEYAILLNSFLRGLKTIHSKGFIHHDLHPGNLMITEAHDGSNFIRLGDLGLFIVKSQYSQASDIYSVGIILWVISTGILPFGGKYDVGLAPNITNGDHPKINEGTPQFYVILYQEIQKDSEYDEPFYSEIRIRKSFAQRGLILESFSKFDK
ncbi:hypothetical protein Glove_78g113 [Diversispora epigaea]|uniref:Protein kinase domain-containing protein n=1 Tax=Diversispora epigaea TaxID=1348612 RepID=A0A397JI39_9GLOM|nr:hypothetical protein Glove_78g113 [Diversispora epigaea]